MSETIPCTGLNVKCVLKDVFVKTFSTRGTFKSVSPSVFRLVIPLPMFRFKHFTTEFKRIAPPFVTSRVLFVVVPIIVPFSTNTTKVIVLSCMVLHMQAVNSTLVKKKKKKKVFSKRFSLQKIGF